MKNSWIRIRSIFNTLLAFTVAVSVCGQRRADVKLAPKLTGKHLARGEQLTVASGFLRRETIPINVLQESSHLNLTSQKDCGVTHVVSAESNRGTRCPASCPLYVQDTRDNLHCGFRCVGASVGSCQSMNPDTPVPDERLGTCRSCRVKGCRTCSSDGSDTCIKCKAEHVLVNGKCSSQWGFLWIIGLVVLGSVFVFIVSWIVSLSRRPILNQQGVERGIRTRSSAKLHMPAEDSPHGRRELYPWSTNLLTTPIAGLGVMHMFTFELVLILWALGVLLAWVMLGLAMAARGDHNFDFFRLGVREPGQTARDNCIIVAWGVATQQRLMSAKVIFVAVLYIVSFALAMLYSIFQLRRHQKLEKQRLSHKGFCAKCTGLPPIAGTEFVEEQLREAVQKTTGEKVLGVSVCWDFSQRVDLVMKIIEQDTEHRINRLDDGNPREERRRQIRIQREMEDSMNKVARTFLHWENFLLSPQVQRIVKKQHGSSALAQSSIRRHRKRDEEAISSIANSRRISQSISPRPQGSVPASCDASIDVAHAATAMTCATSMTCASYDVPGYTGTMALLAPAEVTEVDVTDMLTALETTEDAFIVFDTQASRDRAIQAMAEDSIEFYGKELRLEVAPCEPDALLWTNVTNRPMGEVIVRVAYGVVCIVGALLLWCCCFYLPYARTVMNADYANGSDPNVFSRTVFGFLVVAGNALMYVICAEVSDRVGFKVQQHREMCYMVLYCFACMFNVLLDLTMAYQMAYSRQVGMGMKTHDGRSLSDVDHFVDRFGTYAMQKSLGRILFDYSFPSTFLIPFLVEPLVVIVIPYQIMMLIVRTHPAIIGAAADAYLASTPMDLSRYADVLLNVMLAVLMFFFPGGYIVGIFAALIISHIVIYSYDRYRVLNSIPACDHASGEVELCGQWFLCIPCGLLVSCAAFKANCVDDNPFGHCWGDFHLIRWCFCLFLGHVFLHTVILIWVVPLFGMREAKPHEEPYKTCSELHPCSWFSTNPVHCLRSKYIYKASGKWKGPPCDFHIKGYDYLLRQNEEQHLYFYAEPPAVEDYSVYASLEDSMKAVGSLRDEIRERIHSDPNSPSASHGGSTTGGPLKTLRESETAEFG